MVLVDAIWELSCVWGVGDGAGKVEQARFWGVLNAVKVTLFYAVKKNLSYYGPDSMLSAGKEMTSQVPVFKTCTVKQRICKCSDKWVSQVLWASEQPSEGQHNEVMRVPWCREGYFQEDIMEETRGQGPLSWRVKWKDWVLERKCKLG